MKKITTIFLAIFLSSFLCNAQSVTSVEDVYGGRVNAITASDISGSVDSFNIFISTESANTAFYAKAKGGLLGPASISSFAKMPALTAAAGVGSGIQKIAAYSSYMYFVNTDNKIYKTAFYDAWCDS